MTRKRRSEVPDADAKKSKMDISDITQMLNGMETEKATDSETMTKIKNNIKNETRKVTDLLTNYVEKMRNFVNKEVEPMTNEIRECLDLVSGNVLEDFQKDRVIKNLALSFSEDNDIYTVPMVFENFLRELFEVYNERMDKVQESDESDESDSDDDMEDESDSDDDMEDEDYEEYDPNVQRREQKFEKLMASLVDPDVIEFFDDHIIDIDYVEQETMTFEEQKTFKDGDYKDWIETGIEDMMKLLVEELEECEDEQEDLENFSEQKQMLFESINDLKNYLSKFQYLLEDYDLRNEKLQEIIERANKIEWKESAFEEDYKDYLRSDIETLQESLGMEEDLEELDIETLSKMQEKLDEDFVEKENVDYKLDIILDLIFDMFFYDGDIEKPANFDALKNEATELLLSLPNGDSLLEEMDSNMGASGPYELADGDKEKLYEFYEKIRLKSDIEEIRYEQMQVVEELTSDDNFKLLVDEITQNFKTDCYYDEEARRLLHTAAYDYLVKLFQDSNRCAIHRYDSKVYVKDMHLVRALTEK